MSTSQASTVSSLGDSSGSVSMEPSEASDSYFPENTTASTLASAAGAADTPLDSDSPTSSNPLSPLDRQYTKPLQDLNIAQQLSKQPTYWSAKGWVQRSASSNTQQSNEDLEAKARKFEEAKKDLLASVGRT
ncbi:hypothetical protein SAMD00023353_2800880 [Rosellinia necatrix]|uniref:Uncharacterized protein n=1 Tax=Rosellinia necatrix TaxID=77044 RepID=A0A1W2THX2_ROSNE|nr:hypothetical protein SAMD00023353_2800880 [Rosellinia necatrix]